MSVTGIAATLQIGLVACGSSESDDAGGPFPERFARAYCSSIRSCCQSYNGPFDQEACESSLTNFIVGWEQDELSKPNVVFDSQAADACIRAISEVFGACTNRELYEGLDARCENIFHGTVEAGGSCSTVCAPGTTCSAGAECAPGTICTANVCAVPTVSYDPADQPRAALGAPCSRTCERTIEGDSCDGGLPTGGNCWLNDGLECRDGACAALPNVGQPCFMRCADGAFCMEGACVPRTENGACPNGDGCLAGSYCDGTTRTCRPPKPNGEPCGEDEECAGGQCFRDLCRTWSLASPASCAGVLPG